VARPVAAHSNPPEPYLVPRDVALDVAEDMPRPI
jgi:hypothetical protein